MNYKQKLYYCFAGFVVGNIVLGLAAFGFYSLTPKQPPVKQITFEEALQRIQSSEIKEINLKEDQAEFVANEKTKYSAEISENQKLEIMKMKFDGMIVHYEFLSTTLFIITFQVLSILSYLSPPIIIILLLIIIKQLNSKKLLH